MSNKKSEETQDAAFLAARQVGVDLEYERMMQQESERISAEERGQTYTEKSIVARPSPNRIFADMDESLRYVDLEYEREMQRTQCEWVIDGEGYFMHRRWVQNDGQDVLFAATIDPGEGTGTTPVGRAHTYIRSISNQSIVHDRHPFLGVVHLLRSATDRSTVYVSVPFLTDHHLLDEFCHFAKSNVKDLDIRIIIGPQQWVEDQLKDFVDTFEHREKAISKLHIRRFGRNESSYCHSKAIVSSGGAMIGSYNYTYASRFRHREDAVVLPPGPEVDGLRQSLAAVWDRSEPVIIRRKQPPVGYQPDSKRARVGESHRHAVE